MQTSATTCDVKARKSGMKRQAGMGDIEQKGAAVAETAGVFEYDLADAIYAACLADSLRSESPFYFMDAEDGHSSMMARVA